MAVNAVIPFITKLLLENDRVRVFEFDEKPGEKTELHWHPDYVVYPLTNCLARITSSDGQSRDVEFKLGEPIFGKEQWHTAENIGKTEVRLLAIDLKK